MAATGAKLGTRTRFLREDPVGGGVYVAVAGINGETPPTDPTALVDYARSFQSSVIADVTTSSEALS